MAVPAHENMSVHVASAGGGGGGIMPQSHSAGSESLTRRDTWRLYVQACRHNNTLIFHLSELEKLSLQQMTPAFL